MEVKKQIEYSFVADSITYHVDDVVQVKAKNFESNGMITKISFAGLKMCTKTGIVTIKYDDLFSIRKIKNLER